MTSLHDFLRLAVGVPAGLAAALVVTTPAVLHAADATRVEELRVLDARCEAAREDASAPDHAACDGPCAFARADPTPVRRRTSARAKRH